jgi:hypothetical protein
MVVAKRVFFTASSQGSLDRIRDQYLIGSLVLLINPWKCKSEQRRGGSRAATIDVQTIVLGNIGERSASGGLSHAILLAPALYATRAIAVAKLIDGHGKEEGRRHALP